MEGRLRPGDPIPSESQIALAFGVSKQIAREAIRELSALGVLQVQQGKATRVRAVDGAPLTRLFLFAAGDGVAGLVQAVELRRILEPGFAELAALRRTEADLENLNRIAGLMEQGIADIPSWIEADLAFHQAIANAAGNRLITLQMEGLSPVIRRVMEEFNRRRPRTGADQRAMLQRHLNVIEAVRSGSPEKARAAMNAHFEAADQAIGELRALIKEPQTSQNGRST